MSKVLADASDKARLQMAALSYEPAQYVEGCVEFCGLVLAVDHRALIPRFETERLVRSIEQWCGKTDPQKSWRIADIGTGSGAIAIALAKRIPNAQLFASDISPAALDLARRNAKRHGIDHKIRFSEGSLLEPLPDRIDIIAANLPYIPTRHLAALDPSVRDWEPRMALDGGSDGFDLYRALLDQISRRPQKPSLVLLEIDDNQAECARMECARRLPDVPYVIEKDSSGLTRYVTLANPL